MESKVAKTVSRDEFPLSPTMVFGNEIYRERFTVGSEAGVDREVRKLKGDNFKVRVVKVIDERMRYKPVFTLYTRKSEKLGPKGRRR